ncbi:hypothetical protein AKJ50_00030 [candidate division MSBL1 archaeon SCGC-AAA382A13]|uniref:Uncharacterized protein n=1 Tax=candidate division MSBL1 archaeon SCGC-AAA382A13 TaxID=1698279 RepID=A0A133VH05_9EURY|nr:hypothetical protein AKJ50_00030 [candidate division MSBL1 archaeon SCGC-AAA382A13]
MKNSPILEEALPIKMHLYNDTHIENLDLQEIAKYLKEKKIFKKVEIEGSFLKKYGKPLAKNAEKIAKTQVKNLENPEQNFEIKNQNIEYVKNSIRNPKSEMRGILYDGFRLQKIFTDMIPEQQTDLPHLHVIYTNMFFATWKPATQRYHARVSVYGLPSIISTTGIVDAPARPKGFYYLKKDDNSKSLKIVSENEKFHGDYLDYDDEKMTEIMKGYAMQVVFYHVHSGPFCDKKSCRLYNPHLQKNILKAQLSEPELCEKHQKILENMQRNS